MKKCNFLGEKTVVNQIFNRVVVRIWTAWCTRLKNTQKVEIAGETEFLWFSQRSWDGIFRKLTTDFENWTGLQSETTNVSFLDVKHNAVPYRASSVHFANGNFHPFHTLLVRVQKFEIWITWYPWEKKIPKMVRSALKISLQSDQKCNLQSGTKISVLKKHYNLCCLQWGDNSAVADKMTIPIIQSFQFFWIINKGFFDNIFGNDFCLMNTVLLNFLIVCIQTDWVSNGWKFAVAKWTELAL